MSETHRTDYFCSRCSVEAQEQIFGTASRVDVWFLLEYTGGWAPQAFTGSSLPHAVKEHLSVYLRSVPHARILFIKQQPRTATGIRFFVVVSREARQVAYEFHLASYEDVLALDIPAILSEDASYAGSVRVEPLFLVCTHGTHDKCCAKFGLPIYNAMAKHEGTAVWQCSHVGGDRLAANVVCLPHGIYYGHVVESEIPTIVEHDRRDEIYLEKYRGRSCYSFIEQAGDYLLRAQTGTRDVARFRLVDIECTTADRWTMRFASPAEGTTHVVQVTRTRSDWKNYLSCRALNELHVDQYQLAGHEVLEA